MHREKIIKVKLLQENEIIPVMDDKRILALPDGWKYAFVQREDGSVVLAETFPSVGGYACCSIDFIDEDEFNEIVKSDSDFYDGLTFKEYQLETFNHIIKDCFEVVEEETEE